jgi:hypothetical protein
MTERLVPVDGAELCVETFGDPADPAVLLVGWRHRPGGGSATSAAAAHADPDRYQRDRRPRRPDDPARDGAAGRRDVRGPRTPAGLGRPRGRGGLSRGDRTPVRRHARLRRGTGAPQGRACGRPHPRPRGERDEPLGPLGRGDPLPARRHLGADAGHARHRRPDVPASARRGTGRRDPRRLVPATRGMGHEMPPPALWDLVITNLVRHTDANT